jgi:hypothetical protein
VNVLTALKDIVWVLLLVSLLPVWMALGLGVVTAIVARQLYWWARGNTTVASRLAARVRWSPRHRASAGSTRRAAAGDSMPARTVGSPVDAPAMTALSPAIPGVSEP